MKMIRRFFRSARRARLLRDFALARGGVAAVEFALMIPVMMTIWVGMVVATDALSADKKVTVLARTLADMTTQMIAASQSDLDSIFQAAGAVLWPQPADELGMRLTSVDIDGAGKAFVDWSVVPSDGALRGGYSARARCTTFDGLPAALKTPRTTVVFAEVTMSYHASIMSEIIDKLFAGTAAGGKFRLGDELYMRPRQSTRVTFNPPPAGACPGYVN